MWQARNLSREHPTFVTHLNREDERPFIVHGGSYKSGDCLHHQILQFDVAGSLACSCHLHRICWCAADVTATPRSQASSVRSSNSASMPSDFARRIRRSTGTLEGWITYASIPCLIIHRASQKPDHPASYTVITRSTL